jgi:hypothetical protein
MNCQQFLLDLTEGNGSASFDQHASQCKACGLALAEEELVKEAFAEMGIPPAPETLIPAVMERASAHRPSRPVARTFLLVLVMMIAALAWGSRPRSRPALKLATARPTPMAPRSPDVRAHPPELHQSSAALERKLQQLSERFSLMETRFHSNTQVAMNEVSPDPRVEEEVERTSKEGRAILDTFQQLLDEVDTSRELARDTGPFQFLAHRILTQMVMVEGLLANAAELAIFIRTFIAMNIVLDKAHPTKYRFRISRERFTRSFRENVKALLSNPERYASYIGAALEDYAQIGGRMRLTTNDRWLDDLASKVRELLAHPVNHRSSYLVLGAFDELGNIIRTNGRPNGKRAIEKLRAQFDQLEQTFPGFKFPISSQLGMFKYMH